MLVRYYYRHRWFMGFCCIACEVLYLSLYLLYFPQYRENAGAYLPLSKLLQPYMLRVVPLNADGTGLPIAALVALVSLPGVLTKQLCNWVQLRNAMDRLVEHDLASGTKRVF